MWFLQCFGVLWFWEVRPLISVVLMNVDVDADDQLLMEWTYPAHLIYMVQYRYAAITKLFSKHPIRFLISQGHPSAYLHDIAISKPIMHQILPNIFLALTSLDHVTCSRFRPSKARANSLSVGPSKFLIFSSTSSTKSSNLSSVELHLDEDSRPFGI